MRKRFGIITHYDVHNHGALLQLTALIRVLASKGIQANALRFDKNYDFIGHELKARYNVSVSSIGMYVNLLMKRGIGWTLYNFLKRKKLNKFKKQTKIIGNYYSEDKELDAVIIGSDEVFALHTGITPAFFGHALPSNHVFAYAGSFGPTTISDVENRHCCDLIRSGLRSMSGVTVRDVNSANIVEYLIQKRPDVVIDPVLLYGYSEELKSLSRPKEKNYLLIYAYDNRMNSKEEINAIRTYAKRKKLKIISPGFYHSWVDKNINVDPINLLAYFKFADEIITDTFHGSVMSIITEGKFIVRTRDSNHFKLNSLLEEYGLSKRIFKEWNDIERTMKPDIEYSEVYKKLYERRAFSTEYLDRMINEYR